MPTAFQRVVHLKHTHYVTQLISVAQFYEVAARGVIWIKANIDCS